VIAIACGDGVRICLEDEAFGVYGTEDDDPDGSFDVDAVDLRAEGVCVSD
jgi:hypothetical protein